MPSFEKYTIIRDSDDEDSDVELAPTGSLPATRSSAIVEPIVVHEESGSQPNLEVHNGFTEVEFSSTVPNNTMTQKHLIEQVVLESRPYKEVPTTSIDAQSSIAWSQVSHDTGSQRKGDEAESSRRKSSPVPRSSASKTTRGSSSTSQTTSRVTRTKSAHQFSTAAGNDVIKDSENQELHLTVVATETMKKRTSHRTRTSPNMVRVQVPQKRSASFAQVDDVLGDVETPEQPLDKETRLSDLTVAEPAPKKRKPGRPKKSEEPAKVAKDVADNADGQTTPAADDVSQHPPAVTMAEPLPDIAKPTSEPLQEIPANGQDSKETFEHATITEAAVDDKEPVVEAHFETPLKPTTLEAKPVKPHSPSSSGGVPYRVGLSRRARLPSLLKIVRK